MDPHNDFDKHDRPPVLCRCGHERDDHDSRTEMRRGEKAYVQKCAQCACEVFVDADGPLSRMMKDIPVYPTAIHHDLDGPAGGARGCTQAYQRTPQSTGANHNLGVLSLEEARMVSLEDLRADIIRSAARGQGPTFIAAKLDILIAKATFSGVSDEGAV